MILLLILYIYIITIICFISLNYCYKSICLPVLSVWLISLTAVPHLALVGGAAPLLPKLTVLSWKTVASLSSIAHPI